LLLDEDEESDLIGGLAVFIVAIGLTGAGACADDDALLVDSAPLKKSPLLRGVSLESALKSAPPE